MRHRPKEKNFFFFFGVPLLTTEQTIEEIKQ